MAVKKKVSNKSTTRTVRKKPVSIKVGAKKTAKKTTKPKAKKVTPKKTARKTPAVKKNLMKERVKKASDAVSLPNNMSVRTVEKTAVLKSEFDAYVKRSVYLIAYVSGLCFILVGSTFAMSQMVSQDLSQSMTGQVITSDSANSADGTTSLPNTEVVEDPTIEFLEPVPRKILKDFRTTFVLTDVSLVASKLIRVGQIGFFDLDTNNLLEDKYRVLIPGSTLSPGIYKLKIYVKPSNGGSGKVFESREFQVGPDILVEEIPKEPEPDDTDIEPDSDEDSEEPTEIPVKNIVPFSLQISSGKILTNVVTFPVSAPDEYPWVELYARPVQSLDVLFLSLGKKRSGKVYFDVDSTNLPNGNYEFFARSKYNDEHIKTKPVLVSVRNHVTTSSDTDTSISNDSKDDTSTRPLPPRISDQTFTPTISLEEDVEVQTEKLLSENAEEIDRLFKHYATAQQSSDEMLIETARKALDEKRKALVSDTLRDNNLSDISDNIDEQLSARIANLKERVDTFENIRREKSAGETSIDSDEDGISDYDELNLYGTDPKSTDTDNDGVTDGIEIVRGYNPVDSSAEAVIEFESPRETVGLVRDDVLTMEEVIPVVQVDAEADEPKVKTEIRGKALPNSFVTLYIYSSPTVVTIRTDADGQFVYTFDKELEDGQHDVYVAMTDNAGEIIAQSSPFSFIKEAQAFTPVDAAEAKVVTSDPIVESTKDTYNTVVGIGILAFGLILLMLGVSLRPKDDLDSSEDSDNKETPRFNHIDAT